MSMEQGCEQGSDGTVARKDTKHGGTGYVANATALPVRADVIR